MSRQESKASQSNVKPLPATGFTASEISARYEALVNKKTE